MLDLNEALRLVVLAVEEREAEVARRESALAERESQIARTMYRRGYRAGRAAAMRGAPAITNPESRARGDLRRMLHG